MTALPSNLALVGEDLARATLIDARRSLRRRRLVTYSVAFALLALTGTAAVANRWLFDETPALHAIPALAGGATPGPFAPGDGISDVRDLTQSEAQHRVSQPASGGSAPLGAASGAQPRVLLDSLGFERRTLTAIATTSGGVCVALTGFQVQCVPTFAASQQISWFTSSTPPGPTIIWGVVRDGVTAILAVAADGTRTVARVGNGGFYLELADGPPTRLIVRRADGASQSVKPLPCPLANPDCAP